MNLRHLALAVLLISPALSGPQAVPNGVIEDINSWCRAFYEGGPEWWIEECVETEIDAWERIELESGDPLHRIGVEVCIDKFLELAGWVVVWSCTITGPPEDAL